MPEISLILLSAGNSARFNTPVKKQWLRIGNDPLWLFVAKKFENQFNFKKIIITAGTDEIAYMKRFCDYRFVIGGETRQESLSNALDFADSDYVLVSDVARACIPDAMIESIIGSYDKADIIVPYLDVSDTVVFGNDTINRDKVKLIQTPQLSNSSILTKAMEQDEIFTDDSSAVKSIGGRVFYTKGSIKAKKLTRYDDLNVLECLSKPNDATFVGTGFDVHKFCTGKDMYLAGVKIDSDFGFEAHSDGDVALHALIDSLMGSIGAGDIGELFPDNDDSYKNLDSKVMLKKVVNFIYMVGYEINNVDITIMAQTPKISPYKDEMIRVIADILRIDKIFVNVKATTTEKLGFVGRSEGVAAEAVSSIRFYNWKRA